MRIRSIKPEFWRSSDIGGLRVEDRLLFLGLWSYVDDNGVGRDELADIIGDLFSRDMLAEPRDTIARVQGGLSRLQTAGLITRYEADGKHYLHVTTWATHQRVDKPAQPRYPLPNWALIGGDTAAADQDRDHSRESRDSVAPGTGEQGNRGTGEQTTTPDGVVAHATRAPAPRRTGTRIPEPFIVTADMRHWAHDETPAVDVDASTRRFVDHWRAKTGRDATKLDWPATWRNWLRRDAEDRNRRPRETPTSKDDRARQTLQLGAEVHAGRNGHGTPDEYLQLRALN